MDSSAHLVMLGRFGSILLSEEKDLILFLAKRRKVFKE